jgi:hypothetical protein
MRDAIRQERRVELCFENKRLHDILRWKIADQVLTVDLHGMKIENTQADNSGTWVYTPVGLNHPHAFKMRQYLHPVPQSALAQNYKLVQTPGY